MILRLKLIFVYCLLLSQFKIEAQVNGLQVRRDVLSKFDNIELENKILFIHVWKSDNFESRENNKEFARVSKIYEYAKLRSGNKGVCFINISLDDPTIWRISLQKDSINVNHSIENSSGNFSSLLAPLNNTVGNIVIGNDGEVLAKNLKKEECFSLFRSLITR